MREELSNERSVFVHDFDGVHYPYSGFSDIYEFCGAIKGKVASPLLPLSEDKAVRIGKASYRHTGDGLLYFVTIAKQLGMDPITLRDRLYKDYHILQREWVKAQYSHLFLPCPETNAVMDSLVPTGVRHGLLTQSCLTNWAIPQLQSLDRLKYFEKDALCGFAEVGYKTKKASAEPLQQVMFLLNARPEETVFVEDNLDNLQTAKAYNKKILTVLIHHGQSPKEVPDFVDIATANLATLFGKVADIRLKPEKQYQPVPDNPPFHRIHP